jgi:adenylylsulfate kinase-like enzyme
MGGTVTKSARTAAEPSAASELRHQQSAMAELYDPLYTVWLVGLSQTGKSTIFHALQR